LKDKLQKALAKAGGKLATQDEDTFQEIVKGLIDNWSISRPQEVMLVNRMVSTWMKMRRVEELMSTYDLFFEQRDDKGNLNGINMNQLVFYLSKLDSDFRGYYRLLQGKRKVDGDNGPADFLEFIDGKGKV